MPWPKSWAPTESHRWHCKTTFGRQLVRAGKIKPKQRKPCGQLWTSWLPISRKRPHHLALSGSTQSGQGELTMVELQHRTVPTPALTAFNAAQPTATVADFPNKPGLSIGQGGCEGDLNADQAGLCVYCEKPLFTEGQVEHIKPQGRCQRPPAPVLHLYQLRPQLHQQRKPAAKVNAIVCCPSNPHQAAMPSLLCPPTAPSNPLQA